jgi:Fic family protein
MPGKFVSKTWAHDPAIYAPAKYRRACKYEAFLPDRLATLEFTLDGPTHGLVSESESAIRELSASAGPALDAFGRLLLRTESIASSKVEGMQLGVREMARAEAHVIQGGKASPTAMEVLANIDAMVLAVDDAAKVPIFGIEQILAIHRRLLERDRPRIAGVIRTQQNWIGGNDHNPCGADFVPPPPEEVEPLLADLCDSINADILAPIVQAALVHAQFETIHPFDDGNGRAGRALIHVVLRRRNIAPKYIPPISVVLAAAKTKYIAALTAFRGDEVNAWIEYFADAGARAAKLARQYVTATQALVATWRQRLSSMPDAPRADAAAWAIIDILPAHPVITRATAAAATGRTENRVDDALEQLQKAGVLIALEKPDMQPVGEAKRGRKRRAWEPAGLLDLIASMEAGETPPKR